MQGHHNDVASEKAPSDEGAEYKGMHQLPTVDALSKQRAGEEEEQHGEELHRALSPRQITMIAMSAGPDLTVEHA